MASDTSVRLRTTNGEALPTLLGMRGLNNLGQTCFMNSVLQILLRCPPFMRFFLGDQHNRFACITRHRNSSPVATVDGIESGQLATKRSCLACEMDALFTQCFSGKTAPFSPHSFLHTMWSSCEYFSGYEQQDAHEFLIAALTSLYAGLVAAQRPLVSPVPMSSVPAGPLKRSSSLQRSMSVQDLQAVFTGVLRSDVTCLKCGSSSTKYEEFQDISLELTHLSGFAEDMATPDSASQPVTLAACLQSYTRAERLASAERCWCTKCGELQESKKQMSIHRLPNVLCFHLKRFKHSANSKQPSTKIETYVRFPLHSLNMKPHTSAHVCNDAAGSGSEPTPDQLYDLFGVVVHHGTMQNGHYTNFVRNQGEWFHCDDAVITPPPGYSPVL